jgi:hypothetical protein
MITPPYVSTYATQGPYITASEFLNAPTGVDVSQLLPASGPLTQSQTLANLIRRASGWADSLCNQKLAATVDTRSGSWRVRNDGTIRVPLQFHPVLGIATITAGYTPSTMTPLDSVLLVDVWPDSKNIVTIPVVGAGNSLIYPNYYRSLPDDIYATVQYINGWFDAQITAAVAPGATSVAVTSTLGLNPGQSVYLYGGTDGEVVTVAQTFVPTTATAPGTVPLASPVVGAYLAGDTLTAMPQQIKQAVISLTCVLIKTRGAEAIAMASMRSQPTETEKMESGASDDWEAAVDLLQEFKRVI